MALDLSKPCIVCGRASIPGRARCVEHWYANENARYSRRARGRILAQGDGAAARLRRHLIRQGWGQCAYCGAIHAPDLVEVDHKVPLADGGADIEVNVQVLCRACHHAKTVQEARRRRAER